MTAQSTIKKLRNSRYVYPLKAPVRYARRFVKSVLRQDHMLGVDVRLRKVRLGNDWADWVVAPDILARRPGAIIYSVGLGCDISFDLALLKAFDCHVFGFDPTPVSLAWLATQTLPPRMKVLPMGIAARDGELAFAAPSSPGDPSFTAVLQNDQSVTARVLTLSSMAKLLGHDRIDVLKIDIEGMEFDVLDQILSDGWLPGQLLVEYHHGYFDIPVAKTLTSVARLRCAGYSIFDVSPGGHEFSFIHNSSLKSQ